MAQSVQIKKVSWWHERLADLLIAHPERTLGSIAKELNVTQAWLSVIKNSDVFVDYWITRSTEHSKEVTGGIKSKAFAGVELALDAINERVERDGAIMPMNTLLEVVDVNMKRFGYDSSKQNQGPLINMNFQGLVTSDELALARSKMRDRQEKVIDLTPTPTEGDQGKPGGG